MSSAAKPPLAPLSDLYRACNTAAEQVRRLKVRFLVRYRYCRLVCELKCLLHCECCRAEHCEEPGGKPAYELRAECGHCIPCWAIHTLHRIERLGADADSTVDDVKATDDVGQALDLVRDALEAISTAARDIIDAKDPLSSHIAGEIMCAADHHLECVEAHLRQIADMGESYLVTIV